jgi:hypothetical protein
MAAASAAAIFLGMRVRAAWDRETNIASLASFSGCALDGAEAGIATRLEYKSKGAI